MGVRLAFAMFVVLTMHMNVHMPSAIVRVFVSMHVIRKRLPQPPQTYPDQHGAHDALRIRGNKIHWQRLAQDKGKQTDDEDAG